MILWGRRISCLATDTISTMCRSRRRMMLLSTSANMISRQRLLPSLRSAATTSVAAPSSVIASSSQQARFLSSSHSQSQQHMFNSSSTLKSECWRYLMGCGIASIAALTINNNSNNDNIVLSIFSTATVTNCDNNDDVDDNSDTEDSEVEDPYDNLPEKDEPTHCSICLTYRQGPCRPYWRKVEACTKDHEPTPGEEENEESEKKLNDKRDDDDDDNKPEPPCLKYMMPWIDCASKYRNLYALIELDTNYTEGIADLEATAAQSMCWVSGGEPHIDWSTWQEYLEIINPDWTIPTTTTPRNDSDNKKKVPLWKTLDQAVDPEIVEVKATVPSTRGSGILECAYALDQNNNVIGFEYGTKPSDAVAAVTSVEEDANTGSKDKKDAAGNDSGMATLTIRLVPDRTRHVVIAASYTHVNEEKYKLNKSKKKTDETAIDDSIESHVYKSKPMALDEVGKRPVYSKQNIARNQ